MGVVLGTVMGTRPHLEELRRQGRSLSDDPVWDTRRSWPRNRPGGLAARPRQWWAPGVRRAIQPSRWPPTTSVRGRQTPWWPAGSTSSRRQCSSSSPRCGRWPRPGTALRPEPQGMLPSEGAGILVLESLEHALSRGATILAELCGYAVAADAHHMTAPHPQGLGMVRCMRASLAQAGLSPAEVDYVSAHGTGTRVNDALEAAALAEYFGPSGGRPAVSSIKGMLGHSQGGASAMEAVACIQAITEGLVPETRPCRNRTTAARAWT
ncbi:hypothetical protein NKH18_12730 [Streptomyces sp. M10(2022)]